MTIITKEHLYETAIKQILTPLFEEYQDIEAQEATGQSFDEWLWENLYRLGKEFYEHFGEFAGDADQLVEEYGIA